MRNGECCVRAHCIRSYTSYGPKWGTPWQQFKFSLFSLILCLSNASNKYYHGIVSDKLSVQHKGGLLNFAWQSVVSAHGSVTALNGEFFGKCSWFLSVLLILCLPNVSNKYYHDTRSHQFYAQHKGLIMSVSWQNIVSDCGTGTA